MMLFVLYLMGSDSPFPAPTSYIPKLCSGLYLALYEPELSKLPPFRIPILVGEKR